MKNNKIIGLTVVASVLSALISVQVCAQDNGLTTAYSLDFENEEYKIPAQIYTDGTYKVVSNGDEWKASANWSLIKTTDGKPLSETGLSGTWDDDTNGHDSYKGNLDQNAIFQGWGGSYTVAELSEMDRFALSDKGDDVYVGITSSVIPCVIGSNQVNYDDISVITDPTNPGNNVLKLAPPAMENKYDTNIGNSIFGKNYIDVVGKQTKLSSKVYIDQVAGELRLMLVRDVEFLRSMQYSFNYNGMGKKADYMPLLMSEKEENGYWYDAVIFDHGTLMFGGEAIGSYNADTWYNLEYSLDLEDIQNPYHIVRLTDMNGAEVAFQRAPITVGGKSSLPGISQDEFAFSEEATSYGLMFAATSRLFQPGTTNSYPGVWNGNRAQSGTVAYLDDISFEEREKFALTTQIDEYIKNPVDFEGMPMVTSWFNYEVNGKTLNNNSVTITDNKGNPVTPALVFGNNGGVGVMFNSGSLKPSTVYTITYQVGFSSTMGDVLPKAYTLKFKTKDNISVKEYSLNGTTAQCTFTNNTQDNINGIFVFSIKKKGENTGSRMYFRPAVFPAGNDKSVSIENITIPKDFDSGEYMAEGFLINGFGFLGAITDTIVFN